jgi:vitamin K-dependent gamma-carboxylase
MTGTSASRAASFLLHWVTRARHLQARAAAAVPASGFAATRAAFGVVLVVSTLRFMLLGWVDSLYVEPGFHFGYQPFAWLTPLPRAGMYAVFVLMLIFACGVALRVRSRWCCAGFGVLFTYVELLDKTPYLNHYYLVSVCCGLFAVLPDGHRSGPVSGWARAHANAVVPRACYWTVRAQLVIVYAFAGAAKLNSDWLVRGEPLFAWLGRYADVPWVGALLAERGPALGLSWAGAAFDLAIGPLLLYRKTRLPAFLCACVFHGMIWCLFPVGVFSFLMLTLDLCFFSPSWPTGIASWLRRVRGGYAPVEAKPDLSPATSVARFGVWRSAIIGVHLALQCLIPLRFLAHPGAVNWTEEGFRFAWRVMLTEKVGRVRFCVRSSDGRVARDLEAGALTRFQRQQMSTQPDMIHQYARHLAEQYGRSGWPGVQVFVDSWATLNGRPSQRLVRSDVDLAALPLGIAAPNFVVPLGRTEPAEEERLGYSQCGIGAERK